jgi:hypothetical protein
MRNSNGACRGRGWLLFVIVVIAVVVGIAVWFLAVQSRKSHYQWYKSTEVLILELAPRKPESVTNKQWAQCLMHT